MAAPVAQLFRGVSRLIHRGILRLRKRSMVTVSGLGRVWQLRRPCSVMMVQLFTVHTIGKTAKAKEQKKPELEEIIAEADRLYAQAEVIPLYEYLIQFKDSNSDELLWRLARAAVDKGKNSGCPTEKKTCIYEASEYIEKALKINKENFAVHKWYAILLDYTGEYEGTKQRISNAYLVKEHFITAIKINPMDATSIHSLGYWCFIFADMPWYQKKIAAALFGTPPSSTYDEALKYFQEAERVDPHFYSTNLLMLGKTFLRMKDTEKAVSYLLQARDQPVRTPDDIKCNQEAKSLLKSLGKEENLRTV